MTLSDRFLTIFGLICSEKGYSNLFRASVYLAAFFLVSAFNVLDKTLPIEFQLVEYKAKVEYQLKKEINFEDLQCNVKSDTYVDCIKARHRYSLNNSLLEAYTLVQRFTYYGFIITACLTLVGFFGSPFFKDPSHDGNDQSGN